MGTAFDTHKLITKLAAAGMPAPQAEALSDALKEAQDDLVTKLHLETVLTRELAPMKADILVMKWMLGLVLAGILALVIRSFFVAV